MKVPFDDPRLARHELGFLEIVEKPTEEQLQAYYAEQYFQEECGNYRQSYPVDELEYINLKIAQKYFLIQQAGFARSPGALLDVGCGEGFTMAWFHGKGYAVQGLDFSLAGIKAMNPALADRVQAGDVFHSLQRLAALRKRHDLVWLQHVLEHVRQPVELLRSLLSLTPNDGVLVVTVPNDGNELQESLFRGGDIPERFWIAPPDHLNYFTADSLVKTVSASGWHCLDIIGDFPIDTFLLHPGSNYVVDRQQGGAAHRARVRMELMIGRRGHAAANDYFRACAGVGLGRNLTAILTPAN